MSKKNRAKSKAKRFGEGSAKPIVSAATYGVGGNAFAQAIADPVSVEVPKSPLYLSKEFTPTDLMELIAALQISGAVRRIDGSPADLPTLVDVLSKSFNVRINNPEQCRHAVINRKLRLTRFLDLLRNHLIECSRR